MTNRIGLIFVLINIVFFAAAFANYAGHDKLITRISFYDMKRAQASSTEWLHADTPEQSLKKFLKIQAYSKLGRDCDIKVLTSVENDSLFVDLICGKKSEAVAFFNQMFWTLLQEQLSEFGLSWDREEGMKDFYYMNSLFEIRLDGAIKIKLPRFSVLFEDQVDRISLVSFIVFMLCSILTLNYFLFKIYTVFHRHDNLRRWPSTR